VRARRPTRWPISSQVLHSKRISMAVWIKGSRPGGTAESMTDQGLEHCYWRTSPVATNGNRSERTGEYRIRMYSCQIEDSKQKPDITKGRHPTSKKSGNFDLRLRYATPLPPSSFRDASF